MSDLLHGWTGLILGFSGLIFIHELGHFALAKWNGVRVYVFSLGMGPYLVSFTYRGTVYVLSMIPIGGYVKMMGQDDLNSNLDKSRDPHDYRNKRPGQRACILAAGAAFNLIFTLFAFTVCYYLGMDIEPPRIGHISPNMPLASAILHPKEEGKPAHLKEGDRILEVNGVPVKSWLEAMMQISGSPRNEDMLMKIERSAANAEHGSGIDLVYVRTLHDQRLGASSIGLKPYKEKVKVPLGFKTQDTVVIEAEPAQLKKGVNTPAMEAGLKKGDEILKIEDADSSDRLPLLLDTVNGSNDFMDYILSSKGKALNLTLRRDQKEIQIKVTPRKSDDNDTYQICVHYRPMRRVSQIDHDSEAYANGLRENHFVIDFEPDEPNAETWKTGKLKWKERWDDEKEIPHKSQLMVGSRFSDYVFVQDRHAMVFYKTLTLADAVSMAWGDTRRFSASVFSVLKGLFTGDVNTKALSGPAGIGDVMYTVASTQTFMKYLWFLGFISLNLGVLQFVPIPLLDGWHLLMVAIEKMKGSPVAPRIQEAFQYVGIFLVGGLLFLATFNDIKRMFF